MMKRTLRSPKSAVPQAQSTELDFLDALTDIELLKPFADSRSFNEVIPGLDAHFLNSPCIHGRNAASLELPPGFPPLRQEFLEEMESLGQPVHN